MVNKDSISDELLAAYLDGNTNVAETLEVLNALKENAELKEALNIALQVDGSPSHDEEDVLPMMKLAAESRDNICGFLCEAFILHRRGVAFDEDEMLSIAHQKNWLKAAGTPLHTIGLLLAHYGLLVTRKYDATIEDLKKAIQADNDIIAVVDSDKLYPEREDKEDAPDHAIVVTNIDTDAVKIYDPYKHSILETQLSTFMRAWKESHYYMIQVLQSVEEYAPHPIDVDDVPLDDDLGELQEAIAENAHNVWAEARIKEGWTYGKERDDENKKHPDLVPYTALPDSEKDYDRIMAFNTIKLVKKLGFDIVKRNG